MKITYLVNSSDSNIIGLNIWFAINYNKKYFNKIKSLELIIITY